MGVQKTARNMTLSAEVATTLRERAETGCRGRQCSMNLQGGGISTTWLNIAHSAFCPHSVFMYSFFILFSQSSQTQIFSLNVP